ncbi:HD domain-containing protein [Acinetobacter gerneri]|uniref:N-methyl-D-aspartate receptor NMDAR2C subunit n=1 Tax=Acinetobacter gerneri DSM 14967 = CIP 107464 = MTCC 9824 TaxID=1120926 RepID=N8ZRI9_9GAMM|nr:hypothetical protein [Acinetobacter gerneri]ENV34065.1 hypothetical protein F960_01755 [Acinetobacter gerneri DSM 14967 = CIP 107464 = MTCC 9824]EPR81757.1 hypothetical protein L289_3518 [Acinetobacter gerneri DSM 14967 = CIP 107464 = MTCC 9824]
MNNTQMIFKEYWLNFAYSLGLNSEKTHHILQTLIHAYSQPQRFYHTYQHIVECLELYEMVKDHIEDKRTFQIAIWFHDFIYQPQAQDNEEQSAIQMQNLCAEFLSEIELEKAYSWIIATKQHKASTQQDLNYLLDIDLAILAADATRFVEYEQQIQQEYAWVEPEIYHVKRAEVLQHFYTMQPLYQTAYFREKLEQKAKSNLAKVLNTFKGKIN